MARRPGTRTSIAHDDRDAPGDELLLQSCREGDAAAFATLFRRYHPALVQIAAATSRSFDPEDLAAESFTRIWAAIRDGHGPTQSFLPYARTVVRNVAASWAGRSWESPAEPEQLERASSRSMGGETFEDILAEHQLVSAAFTTLPGRWQSVLWMTEVEGKRAAEVAAELEISPNAAAALSKRARDALGRAWLQAQVDTRDVDAECQWVLEHVGGHVRHSLSAQQEARVASHLETCHSCERTTRRIAHLGSSLRLVAVLAGGTAAGLVAWASAGATPAFAAGSPASPGGAPNPVGSATRSVVKQLARQALTSQGAVLAGVAASVVAIAAVVVPGALSSDRTIEAAMPVGAVNHAPQPASPPLLIEPPADTEPGIEANQPAEEHVAAEQAEPPAALDEGRSAESSADRIPNPKNPGADKGEPEPKAPAERVDPTHPQPEPTDPNVPTHPVDLPDPTDPAEPPDPVEPSDPSAPAEPVEPSDATEPADPADPDKPTRPTEPSDPAEPTDPGDPEDPEDPGDPTEPAGPTDPAAPVDPTDPTGPATPVDPTDPSEPTCPAWPTWPHRPSWPPDPSWPWWPFDPRCPTQHGDAIGPADPQPEPGATNRPDRSARQDAAEPQIVRVSSPPEPADTQPEPVRPLPAPSEPQVDSEDAQPQPQADPKPAPHDAVNPEPAPQRPVMALAETSSDGS